MNCRCTFLETNIVKFQAIEITGSCYDVVESDGGTQKVKEFFIKVTTKFNYYNTTNDVFSKLYQIPSIDTDQHIDLDADFKEYLALSGFILRFTVTNLKRWSSLYLFVSSLLQ